MSRRQSHLAIAAFLLFLLIASSVVLWAADVTPEEVVAKSLDAIGSATARKDLKSRAIQGRVTYRILVGGSGAINGKFVFASEGQKSDYLFKINANGFLGEQFICDGSKASVAGTYPDKSRSEFGNFILAQDAPIRENLLGGVWSITLPTHYDLRYTFEGLSGHTKSIEWDVKATDIMNNRSIDPSAFVPQ
jgi:hypothetical protein